MKTIAVLTDFSGRAENAAAYSLHLAKKIGANILLYNAFIVPADTPMAGQVTWPVTDYDDIKKDTEKELAKLGKKLETELKISHQAGAFLPKINYECEEGMIANNIAALEENKDIVLFVMATHGSDEISAFIFGNNCRQVIDSATIPVLIVPEHIKAGKIGKFVFATDITYSDVQYIKSLAGLARQLSAGIVITNINPDNPLNGERDAAARLFMEDIAKEVDYDHISYHSISNTSVKKGLEWLIENVKFEILVMVHRKSSFFELLFRSSMTKKIADRTDIPLLVYPYPAASIPTF
ncbi:MAG TPA: universal stress protein [Mucilaginibacter sp.]|nr:universal stress protein [Mucilaginibacter sp.]